MLNTDMPNVRRPRGIVKVNDKQIDGWFEFTVENNSFYEADRFTVRFVSSELPTDRNLDWFSNQQDMQVECFAGFPLNPDAYTDGELNSLILGKVDEVSYNPVNREMELHGRDMAGVLVDAKVNENFKNLTSSQVVEKLATKYGLVTKDKNGKSTVTATKTLVGSYYQIDKVNTSVQKTVWDILLWLAKKERFQIYTVGKELHFEPMAKDTDEPWLIIIDESGDIPIMNVSSISFFRNFNVAKGVSVTVHSFNDKKGERWQVTYPKAPKKKVKNADGTSPEDKKYVFSVPNLPDRNAGLAWAEAKYKEIVSHEMKIEFSAPADEALRATKIIKVQGTNSKFDQTYYPKNISKTMSMTAGYSMNVSAQSHAPDTESPT